MTTAVQIDVAVLARELELPVDQVERTLQLLDDGNTIPFITRYRKDRTGGLNEEQIQRIQQEAVTLRQLGERKQIILRSIETQGKLTPDLANKINSARTLKWLEDVYLPFKPKKQSLATTARQRGLEPLAREIIEADPAAADLTARAESLVNPEQGLKDADDVLTGVRHILAEVYSERVDLRTRLRKVLRREAVLVCTHVENSAGGDTAEPARREAADSPVAELDPATLTSNHESESADEAPEQLTSSPSAEAHDDSPVEPHAEAQLESQLESQLEEPFEAEPEDHVEDHVETSEADAEGDATPDSEGAMTATMSDDESHPAAATETAMAVETEAVPSTEASSETVPTLEPGTPAFPRPVTKYPAVEWPKGSKSGGALNPAAVRKAKRKQLARERKKRMVEQAFKDYYNFREAISRLPPHRILAINRGERAKILRVRLEYNAEPMLQDAVRLLVPEGHPHREFLSVCARDSLQRLVLPSLERELRRELGEEAEQHAVQVFNRNLRKLLLQPPVRGKYVLAVDPGFRSGCKLAVVDPFGKLLEHGMITLIGGEEQKTQARAALGDLIRRHHVELVAIGNGAGCRAAEHLVSDVLGSELAGCPVAYVIVNEAGASFYSTSQVGRDELPHCDPMMRSAVSIGRRLQDPLSELVKINPANIGVGMYQHDMKVKHLRESLDNVVNSCVNFVGVELNSASPSLLGYVSGMNQLTARRVFEYRQQHGPFRNREQIKEVPGIGEATYVQAAGFLRISGGDNPLDATWIHPESYEVVQRVLEKLQISLPQVAPVTSAPTPAPSASAPTSVESEASAASVESGTLEPVPQSSEEPVAESDGSLATDDTATADVATDTAANEPASASLESAVTDSTAAPPVSPREPAMAAIDEAPIAPPALVVPPSLAAQLAEVDVDALAQELGIGVLSLQDMLSALARPGRDPRDDFSPPPFRTGIMKLEDLKPGMVLQGTVLNVVDFGAFVDIGISDSALIHISKLADQFVRDPQEVVSVGDILQVWVISVDKERRRVSLSALDPERTRPREPRPNKARRPQRGPGVDRAPATNSGQQQQPAAGGGSPPRYARRPQGNRPPVKPQRSGPPPKPKPVRPISTDMLTGQKPMRSFSDLMQFYEKKQQNEDGSQG